jgi:hypothetical protein
VAPGTSAQVRLRLAPPATGDRFADFDDIFKRRIAEADEFFNDLHRGVADDDSRRIQRQALAGMLWSKQFLCLRNPAMGRW